mmetsp:Transcript_15450/g.39190  ORF Transcript_15450/g.39190 Transcript_15450/m.39190 type:complete len:208 (-) Transcript_15450:355-978(-)
MSNETLKATADPTSVLTESAARDFTPQLLAQTRLAPTWAPTATGRRCSGRPATSALEKYSCKNSLGLPLRTMILAAVVGSIQGLIVFTAHIVIGGGLMMMRAPSISAKWLPSREEIEVQKARAPTNLRTDVPSQSRIDTCPPSAPAPFASASISRRSRSISRMCRRSRWLVSTPVALFNVSTLRSPTLRYITSRSPSRERVPSSTGA